jgi:microsomal dipeptidase-like Zn-dependent dipeptidase
MVAERILIDASHMSSLALEDTFNLLDELDPGREVPVIATHSAFRFGRQAYNLDEATIERIAERGGMIGLILAEHQITDGLTRLPRRRGRRTRSFDESVDVLCRHVDRIRELTGSNEHVGIGSDLDGFIKPTLAGMHNAAKLADVERALDAKYGSRDARAISSGNALRVLRAYWGAGRA